MGKYKAFVLDDDPAVLDVLIESLRFSDFEAYGYSEAERFLGDISYADARLMPDLLVVDLQLQLGKMQGMDVILELTERDVPSEILVISGVYPSPDLAEAIRVGAGAAIGKPFENIFELTKRMEHLAETGMKRRLYRLGGGDMDHTRLRRPVFL